MTTLENEIKRVLVETIAATPAFTHAKRNKALASVKWRLRCGLLCAGLTAAGRCVLTNDDSAEALVFNGLDNEQIKLAYYEAVTGHKFTVELCAS